MDLYASSPDGSVPQHFSQTSREMGSEQQRQKCSSPGNAGFQTDQIASEKCNSQACYNCGSPDHWAQSCPEPRRMVPAGAAENNHPAPKRSRSGGWVTGRYLGQTQFKRPGLNRRNSQPPGYQSNHVQFGNYPHTPMSAHSQVFSPWQLSPQYPPPIQTFPPFGPYGLPTPTTANSSQFPSPVSSHASHQSQGYFPPQPLPFGSADQPPYSQPLFQEQRFNPSQHQHYNREDVPSIATPMEPWMQELQSLDEPRPSKSAGGQIVWRPANPVARPLPSIFSDQDEVVTLPPLTTLQPGMTVSKYISTDGPEKSECNIRQTAGWQNIMDDPIFREIAIDGRSTSIAELIRRRNTTLETHRLQISDAGEERQTSKDVSSTYSSEMLDTKTQGFDSDRLMSTERNLKLQQNAAEADADTVSRRRPKGGDNSNVQTLISHGRKNGNDQHRPSERPKSPRPLTREISRKRALSMDSSEDESAGRRRQEDDMAPKSKRRRPQVADAYSRRW